MLVKAIDRCHYASNDRGAFHSGCNLQYKGNNYIPIIAHISSGYNNSYSMLMIAEKF